MIEKRLESMGIELPIPPKPVGSYIPVVISGNTAFVSGQIPISEGKIAYSGKVSNVQAVFENAKKAAKLCVINALSQLNLELGNLDRISKIIKISGFVNADSDFTEHPQVINAASDLLYEIFEQKGQHSRIAVGVSSLPLDSMVEIDMIVEFE